MRVLLLLLLMLSSLLLWSVGCDSRNGEGSPVSQGSDERSKPDEIGPAHKFDPGVMVGASETDRQELAIQAVALAGQALPGYDWEGKSDLALSKVAPEIDELDVMDLLLKFEEHYKTDITMADLSSLIGRENLDEARHHLTLESISLLVVSSEKKD